MGFLRRLCNSLKTNHLADFARSWHGACKGIFLSAVAARSRCPQSEGFGLEGGDPKIRMNERRCGTQEIAEGEEKHPKASEHAANTQRTHKGPERENRTHEQISYRRGFRK